VAYATKVDGNPTGSNDGELIYAASLEDVECNWLSDSGRDFLGLAQLNRLVEDSVVSLKRGGVVVLIEEDLDRDAGWECPAPGAIGAPVGAEGALTDREIRGVSDDCELDRGHVSLLAPGVL
jgi:hypothetical protein